MGTHLTLATALVVAFSLLGVGAARGADGCDDWDVVTGGCDVPDSSGAIVDDSVELSAQTGTGSTAGDGDDGGASAEPAPPPLTTVIGVDGTPVSRRAVEGGVGDAGALGCTGPVICNPLPEVTMADIAAFRPTRPTQGMEPSGWMVVGLPANFYGSAPAGVKAGTLLGLAAQVRFTPLRYRWVYGDGASAASRSGGRTWAALGAAEFDATPTSHTYGTTGTFTIRMAVDYGAEYSFAGQPWRTIPGTLTVWAPDLTATATAAKTVLVARSCLANPSGPGC